MITWKKTYMDNFVHSGCGNSWCRSREVYSSEYALQSFRANYHILFKSQEQRHTSSIVRISKSNFTNMAYSNITETLDHLTRYDQERYRRLGFGSKSLCQEVNILRCFVVRVRSLLNKIHRLHFQYFQVILGIQRSFSGTSRGIAQQPRHRVQTLVDVP